MVLVDLLVLVDVQLLQVLDRSEHDVEAAHEDPAHHWRKFIALVISLDLPEKAKVAEGSGVLLVDFDDVGGVTGQRVRVATSENTPCFL